MKDDKVFEVPESTTALDEGNLSDYLDCVGEWDGAAGLGFNNVVGEMVAHLSDLNAKAEEEGEAALLDSLQVADEEVIGPQALIQGPLPLVCPLQEPMPLFLSPMDRPLAPRIRKTSPCQLASRAWQRSFR